jgi:hypothetical protein
MRIVARVRYDTQQPGFEGTAPVLADPQKRLDKSVLGGIGCNICVGHDTVCHVVGQPLMVDNKPVEGRQVAALGRRNQGRLIELRAAWGTGARRAFAPVLTRGGGKVQEPPPE